jgi:hypothetical protein
MKNILNAAFALAVVLFAVSCKKEKEDPITDNTPTVTTGNVTLEIEHVIQDLPMSLNQSYVLNNGDTMSFTTFKYYVSNIQFVKADGSVWSESNSYHLIDLSDEASALLTIKDVPMADYVGMNVMIGVDSLRNVSGAQEGALSTTNGMFWSWNTGYIFIKMEGTSSQAMNDAFTYHIGGFSGANNAIQENALGFNGSYLMARPDAVPQVHLMLNVQDLFENGIQTDMNSMVHMPGAAAVAVSSAFSNVLSFEHIHN